MFDDAGRFIVEKERIESACEEDEVATATVGAGFAATASKFGDDDDELAVLPRHTKVIVTGNNRTKSVLVGLQGVVKKAVGLGGWHWLVLTNGLEVKLQRNALSVLEPPTGLEEDDDSDDHQSSKSNLDDVQRPLKLRSRVQKHGGFSRGGNRNSTKMLASDPSKLMRVDFSKFEMASLVRYWRHFDLVEVGPNPSKEQLVNAIERHFMSLQLDETQVIISFMQAAKRLKTICG
ncbi:hypothetical protein KP509_18G085500 [Ceratopteris richardii]|uniref:Histone deacetylase complex subunit SAP30 Sin3 binding domain-containing protein n=1 Tax=Ceratopteris richardii TaxID=49495 RepID=A0A8T2SRK8_CERRI|nr:hypothetical protein KP509_18G085500 [Ceratopteris richardii]KAH7366565.1 hypothetical protein KP509_18G085500 [Ceratopteris richardii]